MSINCTRGPYRNFVYIPSISYRILYNFLASKQKKEKKFYIGFKLTIICHFDNKKIRVEEKHIISLFTFMFSTKIFDRL